MIWFVILTTVMNNGDVYAEVRFPTDLLYNNEQSCNDSGKTIIQDEQNKIGTNAGKVYFICQSTSPEELSKAITHKIGA